MPLPPAPLGRILLLGHRAHTRREELEVFLESLGRSVQLDAAEDVRRVPQLQQWPPYDGAVLFLPMDDESWFADARRLIDKNRLLGVAVCHARAARIAALLESCERRDSVTALAANEHGVPDLDALCSSLERLVQATRTARAAVLRPAAAPQSVGPLRSCSPRFLAALQLAASAAATRDPVHLQGETGAGKEEFARLIHASSSRAGRRFEAVNCATIADDRAEGILFGWRKGGFTGSTEDFPGHFVAADKGTLFLDEVAELSPAVQAKLLRVVQDGVVQPLGARDPVKVDVRIVTATNEDLEQLAESPAADGRRFRVDLVERLLVHVVRVPALREHVEDIPLLAAHFADKAAEGGGPVLQFDADCLTTLANHDWPRNVRQLDNVVRRLSRLRRASVTPAQVLAAIHNRGVEPEAIASAQPAASAAPAQPAAPEPQPTASDAESSPEAFFAALHRERRNGPRCSPADLAKTIQSNGHDREHADLLVLQLCDHVASLRELVQHYLEHEDKALRLRHHAQRLEDPQLVEELQLSSRDALRQFRKRVRERQQTTGAPGGAEA